MVWSVENAQGDESGKIKWEIVPYTRGNGLDLGCGIKKAFDHFIGVDNGHHVQFGYNIRPDVKVKTCENLSLFADESMDFVYSSHLLEHIQDYKSALKEWWRVIKQDGYLVLYLPHKDFYPNVGTEHANSDHKHDFLPEDIISSMKEIASGYLLAENQERNEDDEYSFFQVFQKKKDGFEVAKKIEGKKAAVIRYGAFGDLLQASSIFAGLKKQGFHVTVYSSPPGVDVILNDPNIDQFILQDKDQVPNAELLSFWTNISKKYDRFVNLSESVEGTFLALPGRTAHIWPKEVRHKMMNYNYLQFQHELAGVPVDPKVKFFATEEEKKWAKEERAKMGKKVILWVLAGSSVHKTWPYMDSVIAKLMIEHLDTDVVLVGNDTCKILEAGWENEGRVHKRSGVWSIRETLAFVNECDLVVSPETGVGNAASHLRIPKVVFLSHSSHENLTRDWQNTIALSPSPKDCACYPCHQLHYSWEHCVRHESGGALCQAMIPAPFAYKAIEEQLKKKIKKE